MSSPTSILGVDLNAPGGRQTLQDALDILYGLIQASKGQGAGGTLTTIDELRVKKLTVTDTIDVVPQDKPPANEFANMVSPWLTGQRGRSFTMRYNDQNDGGDLLEWRYQPYPLSTATATTGDWELAAYSAQRDTAGGFRRLGAIRFGHDGRIRTYTSSEVEVFDSNSSSPLTTKGDLYTYSTVDARLGVGADDELLVADSSQTTGQDWKDIATILTAAGIDFGTGATTGRAPVTQEYGNNPGTATATYTPTDPLTSGQAWRITVWGDATGGTAYIKYDGASGTTLTSATGTNPFCIQALIRYKTATSLEATGFFASDGGTTILTPTITGTTPSKQIAVSAGTGGTISSWIVERIGDTAAGTAGGSGGLGLETEHPPLAWWDASLIRDRDGTEIEYWAPEVDTYGRGGPAWLYMRQATAASRPTYRTSANSSGYRGVDFVDGTADCLTHIVGTDSLAPNALQGYEGEQWWVIRPHASLNLATYPTWSALMEASANAYLTMRHHTSGSVELTSQTARTHTASGGRTIQFTNSGSADTITASSGSYITDGWAVGDYVTVAGSTSNDGLHGPIVTLTATVMTFGSGTTLTTEGPKTATTTLNNTQNAYGAILLTLGNPYLIRFQSTIAGGWKLWVNGVEDTLTFSVGGNYNRWFGHMLEADRDTWSIGAQRYLGANAQHWRGWIHEGRLTWPLSDAEAAALTTRLTSKWGL